MREYHADWIATAEYICRALATQKTPQKGTEVGTVDLIRIVFFHRVIFSKVRRNLGNLQTSTGSALNVLEFFAQADHHLACDVLAISFAVATNTAFKHGAYLNGAGRFCELIDIPIPRRRRQPG